jgi:hypothetical protein
MGGLALRSNALGRSGSIALARHRQHDRATVAAAKQRAERAAVEEAFDRRQVLTPRIGAPGGMHRHPYPAVAGQLASGGVFAARLGDKPGPQRSSSGGGFGVVLLGQFGADPHYKFFTNEPAD